MDRGGSMDLFDLPDCEPANLNLDGTMTETDADHPAYRPVSDALALALSVSVVIPVKNEARNLAHVLHAIPDWVSEIILVDGQSTDNTVEVARQLKPDIKVVSQSGTGKGDALLEGFDACDGDIIVAMDGDGSTPGHEIIQFVSALAAGADFVKGSRFASGGGSDDLTLSRRCGNRILLAMVNRMYGTRYTDLCYGYNAFWARHLKALAMDCDGFEVETLMNIRAVKAGLRVHEVPSHEYRRVHGTSNLRVVRDGWRILRVIVHEKFVGVPSDAPGRQAGTTIRFSQSARMATTEARADAKLESL
jgi:glycosyltransferase involved in cell wall biosynthesis